MTIRRYVVRRSKLVEGIDRRGITITLADYRVSAVVIHRESCNDISLQTDASVKLILELIYHFICLLCTREYCHELIRIYVREKAILCEKPRKPRDVH